MNDKEKIEKAFSKMKASNHTLEEVYCSINRKNKYNSKKFLIMSLLGTILTGTIVYAVVNFNISSNFLKFDSTAYSKEMENSINALKHYNELHNQESENINGFFISLPFGDINKTGSGEYYHNGIDFIAEKGTKVLAVADGIVEDTGFNIDDGNYIILKHRDGYETLYMHLEEILVKVGDKIVMGDEIGTVGITGKSTGPHLHFELHHNGEAVNPLEYLKPSV